MAVPGLSYLVLVPNNYLFFSNLDFDFSNEAPNGQCTIAVQQAPPSHCARAEPAPYR